VYNAKHMNFVYLFTAVLAESSGKTVDKLNFRRNGIGARQVMFLAFLAMTACALLYLLVTREPFPSISLTTAALLIGVAGFSFGGNVFDDLSLKADDLSLREPLVDFEPILAGLVGYLIFPAQREVEILIAFLVGALIVHWGIHRRKLRSYQKKGMVFLAIGVCLYAILPSLYQELLLFISPAYLVFFRVSSILVLTSLFFPPKRWKGFSSGGVVYGLAAGVIYAIGALASMYAIQAYGVVLAMLFLMLGPALRYLAGQFILKERLEGEKLCPALC